MASIEFSLMTISIIASLMLVAFAGRVHEVSGNVADAAAEAARSASLRQNPEAASQAANESATDQLGGVCEALQVLIDTEDFKPGGSVAVKVSCRVSLADISLLAIPSTMTIESEAIEVIDRYRS